MDTPDHESEPELVDLVTDFVDHLTGKQTIYQMIRLSKEVQKRGKDPLDPLEYKWMYLERLNAHIESRITGLTNGATKPKAMMVPGATAILEAFRKRDVNCYLASGTDEVYVTAEAAALQIDHYFDTIYGARDDYENFSKAMVIAKIIEKHQLQGPELVAFGDGYVEIQNTHSVGGITVGVASDEAQRNGIDPHKRKRLIEAGADMIIPDFRESAQIVKFLFPER
jgi:phosphoglycolate phosphatase-like HAD superfamily hydrolase